MNDFNIRAFTPVRINLQIGDEYHIIDTVKKATECLTESWPVRSGEAYEEALQACIDGMKDRIAPEQVRQALIKAARGAGIGIVE